MNGSTLYVAGQVAYDGTDYHGFQLQRNVATVQGVLESALQALTGVTIRVTGSGRTDTGVHARGQVIAAHVPWRHSLLALQRAWNAHLPPTVAVRQLRLAPDDFHPRFSAQWRTYRYTVYDHLVAFGATDEVPPNHSPLTDRFALHMRVTLDWVGMQKAANYLVGEHDFATFGQPPQGENTIRCLRQAEWQVVETNLPSLDNHPGRCLVFTVTANAFLRHMVRNLVGTLLAVGRGEWSPEQVKNALAARDRALCAPPAPACGLVLESVTYPVAMNPWV
ncbi:MAG: tRNA pseudouridine(38-40) synthase TruA [Caldilineaceae bacterium]